MLYHFQAHLDDIERDGVASVTLAGRTFPISRGLVEDAKGKRLSTASPTCVEHATAIFTAAKHPKSFVSLDSADHLLSDSQDAAYAAEVLAVWASRYVPKDEGERR
jgi:putative redox protein